MEGRKTPARAFVHRGGGVRIAGTVIACDAAASTDLVFLSHAPAFGLHARRALPRLGSGRRQLLATDLTLALLGAVGQRLKAHVLPAGYGRPFSLGDLRLEMFPSGFMPGVPARSSAALASPAPRWASSRSMTPRAPGKAGGGSAADGRRC